MPQQTIILPNERLDKVDLQVLNDTAKETEKHLLRNVFTDKIPSVSEGFRVQVVNAATRQIRIYNGISFDKFGQITNDEGLENASNVITLSASAGDYYIEVEYVATESDVDSRSFWDPTYDNGNDPSGDPRPKGREFDKNVATRLTPSWSVVTPVSTSGFEIEINRSSTRIPVAKINVSGGTITNPTAPLRSVLREEVLSGGSSTKVKVLDSRCMPSIFTLTLDIGGPHQEYVSISGNDRVNNELTLGSNPSNTHAAGVRVAVGGGSPAQFIVEDSSSMSPDWSGGSRDADASDQRARFFQGDSDIGTAINVDPVGTGDDRSDLQIASLKKYIDFLAAQIREMKFGSPSTIELGKKAPPNLFTDKTRYFDPAGGLLPARTAISMGNGINTWGDFNVSNYTNATDCLIAAVDWITTIGGGILFIKKGTYSLNITSGNSIHLPEGITVVGEGFVNTILINAGDDQIFNIDNPNTGFYNLKLDSSVPGSVLMINSLGIGNGLYAENCIFDGVYLETGSEFTFYNCGFTNILAGEVRDGKFEDCWFTFENSIYEVTGILKFSDCVNVGGGPFAQVIKCQGKIIFERCSTHIHDNQYGFRIGTNSASIKNVTIDNCTVLQDDWSSSLSYGVLIPTSSYATENIRIVNCNFTDVDIAVQVEADISELEISNNRHTSTSHGQTGIYVSSECEDVRICNNTINGLSEPNKYIYGIHIKTSGDFTRFTIDNNQISELDSDLVAVGIYIDYSLGGYLRSGSINKNKIYELSGEDDCFGIFARQIQECTIEGNIFRYIAQSGTTPVWGGIYVGYGLNLVINNNILANIGNTSAAGNNENGGILIKENSSHIKVSDNSIRGCANDGGDLTSCILVWGEVSDITVENNIIDGIDELYSRGIMVYINGGYGKISINDNQITTVYDGIYCYYEDISEILGKAKISGNMVTEFFATGISVFGLNELIPLVGLEVSNNIIYSELDDSYDGIHIEYISGFSCKGNDIIIKSAAGSVQKGIFILYSINGNISSNFIEIYATDSSSACVNTVYGNQHILTASNKLRFGTNNLYSPYPTIDSNGILLNDDPVENFVAGNYITCPDGLDTGHCITDMVSGNEAVVCTRALENADEDITTPGTLDVIGLNIRITD